MQYTPALDGLRAVAILLVALFHARAPYAWGGYVGVDVFFVLSGFLITSLLAEEFCEHRRIDFRAFYWRRMLRLYPALLAMLAVYSLLSPAVWPDQTPLRHAAIAAAYLSDYGMAFFGSPLPLSHTWSLAVEVHYYLIWPVVLLGAFRIGPVSRAARLVLGAYLAATLWRTICSRELPWAEVYYRFDTRLPGLLLGSWLALALRLDSTRALVLKFYQRTLPMWIAAGITCAVLLPLRFQASMVIGLPLVEWSAAGLVVACCGNGWAQRALSNASMVWLGKLSYGVYLWHLLIFDALRTGFSWWRVLCIGLPLSLALAWVSLVTVEKWARSLKARTACSL